ncbi:V-type ATP synthase subunit A, partial [Candidatus Dependentiae bacterium]|nr:V-type ATP synthase subunit A [Candidatus Dependentiae bacterium]
CGERGNEMTQVLEEFPKLIDPRSGRPLIERTILIANTSNMPVTARESSIYTGITIAEYFRDMGYNVAIMADSTSRWAEALREISGRLEEIPAEEGFPSYLSSRLAEFYERAGLVQVHPDREGSVTAIGAVSPQGGDFSEPVTQNTKRFVRAFWALDKDLAGARHFPSVSWIESYSEYVEEIKDWWQEYLDLDWYGLRKKAVELFQLDKKLQQIVKLVGPDALPDKERIILLVTELLKVAYLQQNAFDEIDMYCVPEKQIKMFQIILDFFEKAKMSIEDGIPFHQIQTMEILAKIKRMKLEYSNKEVDKMDEIFDAMKQEFNSLREFGM